MLNDTTTYQNPVPDGQYFEDLAQAELNRLVDPQYIEKLMEPHCFKAVGYARVSTKAQAKEDKVSLKEQKEAVKDFIANHKWQFVGFFEDAGKSGTKMDSRDQFQQMLEGARNGLFDVIVGWSTDRFARNAIEMTQLRDQLRKRGIQITSVNEPVEIIDPRKLQFEDRGMNGFMDYFMDFKAQEDNKTRTKRFEMGKMGKAKQGKIPCKTPYGYRKHIYFVDGDRNKKIEEDIIVLEEREVVIEIFDLYDQKGYGMRRIAEHLNFRGILSPTGKKWCYSTIKYILRNPTYVGAVRYGWRLAKSKESRARLQAGHKGILEPGKHEPIISREQFERVKKKMEIKSKLGGRAVGSKGLLSGIAKCGRCGGGTYVTQYHHWFAYQQTKEKRTKYTKTLAYLCSNYSSYGRSGCSARYVMAKDKLEGEVVKHIRKLANSNEAREAFIREMKKNNREKVSKEIESLQDIVKNLEARRQRQKLVYESGHIPLEEYLSDIRRTDQEKTDVLIRLENKQEELKKEEEIANKSREALLALADFDKTWEQADFVKKKELLQSILDKVLVTGNKVKIFFANKVG